MIKKKYQKMIIEEKKDAIEDPPIFLYFRVSGATLLIL